MNESFAICTFAIIALTSVCSLVGFRDSNFREKHLFAVREILAEKQYHRLLTSAFLHADWNHLLLNMFSLYLFGRHVELLLGVGRYLLIYFAAIVGGSLLSLWMHRHHEYHAYGASGGVCGMIFSYILLFPGGGILMFPLPVSIPAWLYAVLFFIGSFLALKRQADNVGHDAHLGGAIIGMWTTAALEPWIFQDQLKLFLGITVLSVLLFVYLAKNPLLLPLVNFSPASYRSRSKTRGRQQRQRKHLEVDSILEKISERGIDSLSEAERRVLNSVSEKYRRKSNPNKSDNN